MRRHPVFFIQNLITVSLLLLLTFPVFASFSPKRISLSSPLYDQVDALYRLEGLARPSDARPWSNEEAAQIIKKLPDSLKTRHFKEKTLSLLEKTLKSTAGDDFSYRISTTVALEAYAHTNMDDFIILEDWIFGGDERKPLLNFRMEAQFGTIFYFGTSIEAGIGLYTRSDITEDIADENIGIILPASTSVIGHVTWSELYHRLFSTNAITADTQFYANWPNNSQITLGSNWWNVSMARGAIRWGNGKSGDLVIGGHINLQNTLRFDFFSNGFKMELLYLFLEDHEDEVNQRIFMGRRFEFEPFTRLRATITENVMYRGPSLEMKYLNPTSIYHNYYNSEKFNSIASLEINFAPCKGFSLYGQFALDQYQMSNETDSVANAMGRLIGAEYSWLSKEGIFSTSMEYVLTDPSLYRRDKINFLLYRGLKNNGDPYVFDYLGYQYGSDSQVLRFDLSYLRACTFKTNFTATVLQQGEVGMYYAIGDTDTTYANILSSAPSGDTIRQKLILGLQGTWWPAFAPAALYGQINWIGKRTFTRSTEQISDREKDLQLILGVSFTF
ncbi:hypothetical protein SpiGrapes_1278 [Sphaerochaeta pleomorpha str. Grapes]|uniref:Capsule assembly protein Wzi n=1 Tax=Sphaerochaeta pleomorpha (strain ATCC BAA-1885 / DSM 22778 / Grapes) TaxID=158190 RepID=G8QTC4_SPHPG|nr:hypothetical protein [Sphaerochaeta pleomorpha]AEV29091.1 hypothetical protein SpiGrapes_1278 [Sphaerochaeta pleomorpha str. Grapes]